MSKTGIRVFIALDLSLEVKEVLEDIQFDMLDYVSEEEVRWVKSENMHLTLSFLGNHVGPDVIPQVCDQLDAISAETDPFSLYLAQLGAFPSAQKPRVLWVGVADGQKRLKTIRAKIDHAMASIGWEEVDKRFNPHLTIGYVKDKKAISKAKIPYGSYVTPKSWEVNSIKLYHSHLTKNGPRYKAIHTANLTLT